MRALSDRCGILSRVPGPGHLRTALEAAWRADGIILLTEPDRPLTAADVVDVLGTDVVAEIPVDAAVARSIDAGLLLAHLHRLSAIQRLARLVQPDPIPPAQQPPIHHPRLQPTNRPQHPSNTRLPTPPAPPSRT